MARYEIQDGESLVQIARRHGLKLRELIELNPDLADNPEAQVGQRLRLGRGVDALGPDGKPWQDPGFLANPPGGPGGVQAPGMGGAGGPVDPETPYEPQAGSGGGSNPQNPQVGIAWQDPAFVAFMRRFDIGRGRIRSDRRDAVLRLHDQFRRNKPIYEEQKREGRENINQDYSGRGMYFSGGRQRDITDLVAKVNRNKEMERQGMMDNITDVRKKATRGVGDLNIDREEERLAAYERQSELDRQMATGQA